MLLEVVALLCRNAPLRTHPPAAGGARAKNNSNTRQPEILNQLTFCQSRTCAFLSGVSSPPSLRAVSCNRSVVAGVLHSGAAEYLFIRNCRRDPPHFALRTSHSSPSSRTQAFLLSLSRSSPDSCVFVLAPPSPHFLKISYESFLLLLGIYIIGQFVKLKFTREDAD